MKSAAGTRRSKRGRVSSYYGLGLAQYELDFVDVDVWRDLPVFIDPGAFRSIPDPWFQGCIHQLQTFFEEVLSALQSGNELRAFSLLHALKEPNDTRLGLSKGPPRGRAVGRINAHKLLNALRRSKAASSGILQDLEDAALFVPGIGSDIVSDITTNIIRSELISYTKDMATLYGIPVDRVPSGITWDSDARRWKSSEWELLPNAGGARLLLVPKAIVRRKFDVNRDDFYTDYILDLLAERELSDPKSELVYTLKSGERRVNKSDLREKYKNTKAMVEDLAVEHPQVYEDYKRSVAASPPGPVPSDTLNEMVGSRSIDFDALLLAVVACEPGNNDFDRYEKALRGLLSALFYPNLVWPRPQKELYGGIKRVDLTYTNMGTSGFFKWLSDNHPSGNIFIEAKNYSSDVKNPEFDQLLGRFSPNGGRFGFLICRKLANRSAAIERARTYSLPQNKFIIPVTDDTLKRFVEAKKAGDEALDLVLKELFDEIAL